MKGKNGLFNNLCNNLSIAQKIFQQGLKKEYQIKMIRYSQTNKMD